jgi:hypothetical protein
MQFGKGLEPFHKTTKQLLVPSNGGSLGGDGIAELVQVMASSYSHISGEDPDADSVKVTKMYYQNRGQAKRQFKDRL